MRALVLVSRVIPGTLHGNMKRHVIHVSNSLIHLKEFYADVCATFARARFVPPLKSVDERLKFMSEAIEELGYTKEFALAIDAAASQFYGEGRYDIMGKEYSSAELTDFYSNLCGRFRIMSVEDGLSEDDWVGWIRLNSDLGEKSRLSETIFWLRILRELEKQSN